jgi:hypothetical protein
MDAVALAYYALICGLLAAAGPRLGRLPARFVAGVVVGLAAAAVLPHVRTLLAGL